MLKNGKKIDVPKHIRFSSSSSSSSSSWTDCSSSSDSELEKKQPTEKPKTSPQNYFKQKQNKSPQNTHQAKMNKLMAQKSEDFLSKERFEKESKIYGKDYVKKPIKKEHHFPRATIQTPKLDYSKFEILNGSPRVNDRIAFQVLEISSNFTPEVSEYKSGTVLEFDQALNEISLKLDSEHEYNSILKRSSKFSVVLEDTEDEGNQEIVNDGNQFDDVEDDVVLIKIDWSNLMNVRLISKEFSASNLQINSEKDDAKPKQIDENPQNNNNQNKRSQELPQNYKNHKKYSKPPTKENPKHIRFSSTSSSSLSSSSSSSDSGEEEIRQKRITEKSKVLNQNFNNQQSDTFTKDIVKPAKVIPKHIHFPSSSSSSSSLGRSSSSDSDEEKVKQKRVVEKKKTSPQNNNKHDGSKPDELKWIKEESNASKKPKQKESNSHKIQKPDYTKFELLSGAPKVKDRIAFQVLEISSNFTPEVSEYKSGTVLEFDQALNEISLKLDSEHEYNSILKRSSKFSIILEDTDDEESQRIKNEGIKNKGDQFDEFEEDLVLFKIDWSNLMNVRLIPQQAFAPELQNSNNEQSKQTTNSSEPKKDHSKHIRFSSSSDSSSSSSSSSSSDSDEEETKPKQLAEKPKASPKDKDTQPKQMSKYYESTKEGQLNAACNIRSFIIENPKDLQTFKKVFNQTKLNAPNPEEFMSGESRAELIEEQTLEHDDVEKSKQNEIRSPRTPKPDYSNFEPLNGAPRVNDKIAFQVIEMSPKLTQEVSEYKLATVLGFDEDLNEISLKLEGDYEYNSLLKKSSKLSLDSDETENQSSQCVKDGSIEIKGDQFDELEDLALMKIDLRNLVNARLIPQQVPTSNQ